MDAAYVATHVQQLKPFAVGDCDHSGEIWGGSYSLFRQGDNDAMPCMGVVWGAGELGTYLVHLG